MIQESDMFRKLGPSSGKCNKCGALISVNPPMPCMWCNLKSEIDAAPKKQISVHEEEIKDFLNWYWREIDGKPYHISANDIVEDYIKDLNK